MGGRSFLHLYIRYISALQVGYTMRFMQRMHYLLRFKVQLFNMSSICINLLRSIKLQRNLYHT